MKSETRRGEARPDQPAQMPDKSPIANLIPFVLYLTLTGVLGFVHYGLVDIPNAKTRATYHEQVVNGEAPAPIQHRILVPLAADRLHRDLGLPLETVYIALRAAATLLNLILFHALLARWLPAPWPLTGTLFLAAVTPILYLGAQFQEADHWSLTIFLAALHALAARRDGWLWPLTAIGMLNREDAVFLPLLFLLLRFDRLPGRALLLQAGGLGALALVLYAGLRTALGARTWYADFFYLQSNLTTAWPYAALGLTFSAFAWLAWMRLGDRPLFWRRAAAFVPFFLATHLVATDLREVRVLMPLLPVVLPLGFLALAARSGVKPLPMPDPPPAASPFAQRPGAWHAALWAGFLIAFGLFAWFGQRQYQSGFDHRREAVQHYLDAKRLAKAGDRAGVIAALRRAIAAAPESTVAAAARKKLERITAPTP